MSTDDQSKKDEQNTTDPAQKPATEQASPVFLFPENSVYDLEPIVVPDNMKLAAPADDEVTIEAGNSQSWASEVQAQPKTDNPSGDNGTSSETNAETPGTNISVSTKPSGPQHPPIGSTLGKLKITPRKVKATAENVRIQDSEKIEPSEQTDELVQATTAESNQSKTAESPAANAETNSNDQSKAEWTEHASAVLEHFGWEQAGWSVQKIGTSQQEAQENIEIKSETSSNTSAEEPAASESSKKEEDDADSKKNFFPEHSAFDLEPIVVPDDQRLGPPVAPQPKIDPRTTAQHQKLSPIKIGQHKPAAKRIEPTAPRTTQISDAPVTAPAAHAGPNGGSEVSLAQSEIALPSSNGEHIVISEPSAAQSTDDHSAPVEPATEIDLSQTESTVVIEESKPSNIEDSDATAQVESAEQQVHVPEPASTADPTAAVEGGVLESTEHDADISISESTLEVSDSTVDISAPDVSEPDNSEAAAAPESIAESSPESTKKEWNEEQTGWEEIVDKQERWQERTGWEEAVEEKSEWERSGWSDSDSEEKTASEEASNGDSNENSQSISEAQPEGFQWAQDGDTASGAEHSEVSDAVEGKPESETGGFVKPVSVGSLFGDDNDEEDLEVATAQPSHEENPEFVVGVKTLEIEPTDRQEIENRIGTATGDNQPYESEQVEGDEKSPQSAGDHDQEITGSHQNDNSPPAVSGQFDVFNDEPADSHAAPGGLDINNLGIGTADIDQIILEHSNVQLTLRSGALEEAEEEERVLRELLLTEQRDAEREAQKAAGIDPQSFSQEITNPEFQNAAVGDESDGLVYDEEDVLQEFQPTDSIYELAPFVLPAAGERLTDKGKPVLPKTLQQAVNATAVPERAAVPVRSSDPLVGTTLAHSYEVLDVIGQGGMAIVYRAKQIATGRLVAIKTLKSQSPQDIMRFSQEIKTHSQLEHKNVVDFIDSFTARGQLFLVMERIRGISLEEIIRTFGKLDDPSNIVDILCQILDALEYAHSGGLIHRDLKTGNVILIKEQEEAMVVKILDFGIAKIQGDLQRLTHVGQALGSPIYMSPEQCSGKLLTTRSDLYSLGVVAYETVTGTPPYSKGTLINVMAAHCNENIKPKPLSEMAPHLPKYKMLDQILQKALQTPAEKRWQSAAEFRTALQFWLRSVEMDASYDELPVELMRSPVTEFDLDKLVASASVNSTPSRPAQPTFTWAQEPEPEPAPAQTETTSPPQGVTTGENASWTGEEPEHDDIWPDQQGGWESGAKPLESVAGWGEQTAAENQNELWGGSEKHRQDGQDTSEATPAAPIVNAPFIVGGKTSDSNQAIPDPNQKLFQSDYQAETSDLWNAQQNQINQKRSTVRDLLASPVSEKGEQSFEVKTSTDMYAIGRGAPVHEPIEQAATPEFKFGGETAPANLVAPDANTTGGAEVAQVSEEPIDLRRRQTPAQPLPTATNNVLYIIIGIVVGLLFASLFGYYFFIQTDTFHLRPATEEKKQIDPFEDPKNNPAPATTPPAPDAQPESSEKPSADSDSADSVKIDQPGSTEDAKPSNDTTSDATSTETSTKAEDSKGESTPESSTQNSETKTQDTATPDATTQPKKDEPIPFKKGEPEEGVDF